MGISEWHQITVRGAEGSKSFRTPPRDKYLTKMFAGNLDNFAWSTLNGQMPIVSHESAMDTLRLIWGMYHFAGVENF
jgi:hypothetical protein